MHHLEILDLRLVIVMGWDFGVFPREGIVICVGEGSKELFRLKGWAVAYIPVTGGQEI